MYGQQKDRDSVMAAREALSAQQQFTLSDQQTGQLTAAGIRAASDKRRVFKLYWKTDAFLTEMAKVEQLKDSVYEAVLGPQQFRRFRENIQRKLEDDINTQRAAWKQTDSVTSQKSQNENK
jgi:ABC-type proline/glycine betaine transport system substrate-binding protein